MAIYQPLQKENKRWYYTCTDNSGVYDTESCTQVASCPKCRPDIDSYFSEHMNDSCDFCNSKRLIEKQNPCPGHDTSSEAVEHNRQYQVPKALEGFDNDTQQKCKVCEKWTQRYMWVPGDMWMQEYLCDEHCNIEGFDAATKPKPKVEPEKKKHPKPEGFIPKDFDEAVAYLVKQKVPTGDLGFHFLGGMSLRNDWGLWHNYTPIAKWFTERQLYHGDDRSGILSEAVKAHLKCESFNVDDQIKYYQEWWFKQYGEGHSLEDQKRKFFEYALDEDDYVE